MSEVRVRLLKSGISELFKSEEMESYLSEVADEVITCAETLSGGRYGKNVHKASNTAIANVYPDSAKARQDNYHNNTALKAVRMIGLPGKKPEY